MALETMIALALLELEDKLLLALELIDDLGRDLGLGKLSGISDDLLAVVQEEDLEPTSASIFSTVMTSS